MSSISSTLKKSSVGAAFLALLALVHFSTSNPFTHKFINFDDYLFIDPMLKLSLRAYFTDWIWDPFSYAFPIRDLTFFGDKWMSAFLGVPTFWVHQLLLLGLCSFFAYRIFRLYWPYERVAVALLFLFAFHPLHTEIVQWASSRRNVLVSCFLFLASYLFLKWQNRKMTLKEWTILFSLWVISLLVYPTGLLWIFAVLWLARKTNKKALPVLTSLALFVGLSYWLWMSRDKSDFGRAGTSILAMESLLRAWYFGIRSLGRGFFNFILPFQLAPFYDEDHALNWVGLFGALLCGVLIWRTLQKSSRARRQELLAPALLGAVLFAPQALVFLAFPDFVWADRYTLVASPFLLLVAARLWWPERATHKTQLISLAVLVAWLTSASLYIGYRAPLWRDDVVLFQECASREVSPRCLMEVIQLSFHNKGCAPIQKELEAARRRYQTNLPEYGSVFKTELPFYDAACVALSATETPQQKVEHLPQLFDFYRGSPEIVFGITLAHLQAGHTQAAWESASKYYLDGHPERLRITKALTSVYLGHSRALCEILQTSQCAQKLGDFESGARDTYRDKPLEEWAYRITHTVYHLKKP